MSGWRYTRWANETLSEMTRVYRMRTTEITRVRRLGTLGGHPLELGLFLLGRLAPLLSPGRCRSGGHVCRSNGLLFGSDRRRFRRQKIHGGPEGLLMGPRRRRLRREGNYRLRDRDISSFCAKLRAISWHRWHHVHRAIGWVPLIVRDRDTDPGLGHQGCGSVSGRRGAGRRGRASRRGRYISSHTLCFQGSHWICRTFGLSDSGQVKDATVHGPSIRYLDREPHRVFQYLKARNEGL